MHYYSISYSIKKGKPFNIRFFQIKFNLCFKICQLSGIMNYTKLLGGDNMRGLVKALCIIGIVVGGLLTVKLMVELWSTNVKKYFEVEKY